MPARIAVADTSVLVALHHLRLLTKLSLFYDEILVPTEVRNEFVANNDRGNLEAALDELIAGRLFAICDHYDTMQVELYRIKRLHRGESEALSQMVVKNAGTLLIDERRARKIALQEMRSVKGTAAILAELARMGYVDYKQSIHTLRTEIGFRITDELMNEIYARSLEQPPSR